MGKTRNTNCLTPLAMSSNSECKGGIMSGMVNLFAASISFASFAALAVMQATEIGSLTVLKDVGMGGAFIITCVFIIRYMMSQIEKMQAGQKEQFDKIIALSEKVIKSEEASRHVNEEVIQILGRYKN
jgi:hypothetical protein